MFNFLNNNWKCSYKKIIDVNVIMQFERENIYRWKVSLFEMFIIYEKYMKIKR